MIVPPEVAGVAFSQAADGDLRHDLQARDAFAAVLGLTEGRSWATVSQVHGADVEEVDSGGDRGAADALWTTKPGLPLAVFTADCFGLVLRSEGAVGVAHVGWRGAAAGVVSVLREAMSSGGHRAVTGLLGPGIGPCCYEVGPEVLECFPDHQATTLRGRPSVDLAGVIFDELAGVSLERHGGCTLHDDGYFSHRRDATTRRMTTVGWLP